jgi:NAD(P)H-dependent flavin oxidoreductase YrpB (nitropropane dioxygenase family)
MIRTRFTELLGIRHPVVLGGMASVPSAELVAAVSRAGGLGVLGATRLTRDQMLEAADAVRARTDAPFGLNLLLFLAGEEQLAAVLEARPRVVSTAWPAHGTDLAATFARAHEAGCLVMHMVSGVAEAEAAEAAGADLIVAQGTEGGGHVGTMGSSVLVPMVAAAVPTPVLAAGGFATGAGLVAALALGAEGVLLGTRFLATVESPLHENFKRVIVDSDGHDTVLSELVDVAQGTVWPGAYARTARNRLVEEWLGREGELRRRQPEVLRRIQAARAAGDPEYAILYTGQTAGLINDIRPAADVVESLVAEAEDVIRERLRALTGD